MRSFWIIAFCLFPFAVVAQTAAEEDEGFLVGLIEENLSTEGTVVNIVGFEGALSSEASLDQLTVADTDGVWLTLEDVVLSWNRAALFRGAIDVQELSAARIVVSRAPIAEESAPSPEAAPFSLPELPVSVVVDALNIGRIELGDVFLGEPVVVSLTGAASLAEGEGAANIVATRIGEKQGQFEVDGSYANATRALDLLLRLAEGPDGIAARLLNLPGRPSVGLEIAGAGPLDAYGADLTLATNGQERLSGRFDLAGADGGQEISLDVAGDISPLLAAEYGAFFGNDASLRARVVTGADGRVDVPELALDAGRIGLDGTIAIGADGWPARIDIAGGVTATGGDPVLLPLAGPRTLIDGADLRIAYDAARADDWQAALTVHGLTREGLSIGEAGLQGGGILRSGADDAMGLITATLQYGATGLQLADAGAAEAFGDAIEGVLQAEWQEGDITRIPRITLTGAGIDLAGNATVAGPDAGLETNANIAVEVAGLERFAALVGQDLGGAAALDVVAAVTPADGGFRVTLDGETTDLQVGVPEADAVLAGTGTLRAEVTRDSTGTRLRDFRIATDAAEVTADATLQTGVTNASFRADLRDVALVLPDLSGAARLFGTVTQEDGGPLIYGFDGTGPAVSFAAEGDVTDGEGGQRISFDLSTNLTDLVRYAALADRPLAGALTASANGVFLVEGQRFDADISALTRDVQIGDERIDPLLAGQGVLRAGVARTGGVSGQISDLLLQTPALSLVGDANLSLTGANAADLRFALTDASLLDAALSGPITANLVATPADAAATDVVLQVTGPETDIAADVQISGPDDGREVSGDVNAQVADLGAYAPIVGQPIDGSVDLTASGTVLPDLSRFETQVNLQSEDLEIGNPTADALLAGTGRINATIGQEDGTLFVRTLEVSTREVSIVAALNGAAGVGQGRFNASMRDVGVLTDQISGPVRARGGAALDDAGNWDIDATGTGPGGLQADVVGQYLANGNLAMEIDGRAPLALANTALDPRRLSGLANFDVAVNGPPALTSLSGEITFSEGRLAAPNLGEALTDIGGQIRLGNARAQIDVGARVESGGSMSVSGPVGMGGGNNADITLRLNDVVVQDPNLYETRVDGAITINGPLAGGARIAGRMELGQTDVQVPSSAIGTLGDLPDVTHVGAPADVRQTLRRAGIGVTANGGNGDGVGGPVYPLDITINAPSRIFIRGRGLDAELGGQLTVRGTTANVIPVGQFSLIRGRIDILQQRFQLTEGVASLEGSFDPFIRLVATTETDTGTVVSIIVEGPAGAPEVRFESVPELPQDEVLAQLIFGRDLDSISPLQAVQLASAISTLAGGGGGALSDFRENLGLDDLDVTTDEEGTAAVRAGAYVSENIYTDVTVTSDGGTEINLNLDLTDDITARGGVDEEGDTSIGLFFERDY